MQLRGVLCLVYEPSNCFQTRATARCVLGTCVHTLSQSVLPPFFPRRWLYTMQWSEAVKQRNGIGGICNMTCMPIHGFTNSVRAFRWRPLGEVTTILGRIFIVKSTSKPRTKTPSIRMDTLCLSSYNSCWRKQIKMPPSPS